MVEAQLSQLLKNSTLSPFHLIHPRPECLLRKERLLGGKIQKEKNKKKKGETNLPTRHMWGVFHTSFIGFSKLNIVLA
jgi:hypothetical protein